MSSLAAATLSRAGVSDLLIANRTPERAERLAASLGARTVEFAKVPPRRAGRRDRPGDLLHRLGRAR